jgi:antirestriction protein ArdC
MTFKQALENETPVRKGEHGTKAIFFSVIDPKTGDDESNGYAMAKWFTVFNIAQLDGYKIPESLKPNQQDNISEAENFIISTEANIQIGGSNSAFYSPSKDIIVMPSKDQFFELENFYSVLFHELTHWTGHKTRLDRSRNNAFGDEAYAFEELIAELGAAFLCSDMGISHHTMPNHVSYLNNWLTILKSHNKAIFKAASQAEKAIDFLKSKSAIQKAA